MMATKIATPTASAACRIMLMTPEPVANDDGGSDDVPTPISVGKVKPDADAGRDHADHRRTATFGSSPISAAQQTKLPRKEDDAGGDDGAAPNRAISRPAKQQRRDRHQQRPGRDGEAGLQRRPSPGRSAPITRPTAASRRRRPNNGAITSAAPVNGRIRNSAGSTNGLRERRQCQHEQPRQQRPRRRRSRQCRANASPSRSPSRWRRSARRCRR